jgi:hypothetical protein
MGENCGPLKSMHNLHPRARKQKRGTAGRASGGVGRSNGPRAAADEVDDLDAVAFFEQGRRPIRAADDLLIALDGEPLGPEPQQADKGLQRRALRDFPFFAVDLNPQPSGLSVALSSQ